MNRLPFHRRAQGEDGVEDAAEHVDVGTFVDPIQFAARLLGRNVRAASPRSGRAWSRNHGGSRPAASVAAASGMGSGRGSRRVEVMFFARPQSMTSTSPNEPIMIFSGFRSRWTMLFAVRDRPRRRTPSGKWSAACPEDIFRWSFAGHCGCRAARRRGWCP